MKMKALAVLAAVFAVLFLSACSSENTENNQSADISSVDEHTNGNTNGKNDEDNQKNVGSTEINNGLVEAMTPEGAKITANAPGSLMMQSNMSFSELIMFYEAALKNLGVKQESVDDIFGWTYLGTYDGGKEISVTITNPTGETKGILIGY